MIHDCNDVIEIEDDTVAVCRREQFELSSYEGNNMILHKHDAIKAINDNRTIPISIFHNFHEY